MNLGALSPDFRGPAVVGLLWVAIGGVFSVGVLDMGETLNVYVYSAVIYGVLWALIVVRRAESPTAIDLWLLKWLFLPLFVGGMYFYPYIWHLRHLD